MIDTGTLGAHVAVPGPNILDTHSTIGTIGYVVSKIQVKSRDDWVVEVQRSFFQSTTAQEDHVKRVTCHPTVLTF